MPNLSKKNWGNIVLWDLELCHFAAYDKNNSAATVSRNFAENYTSRPKYETQVIKQAKESFPRNLLK